MNDRKYVYDGDTIRADIDYGFRQWGHYQPLRLTGLDAPELRGIERVDGLVSRDWLREQLPVGTKILIQTEKDRTGNDSTEKYGRYLATIWLLDGTNLNEKMIAAKMAGVYPPSA